ncbi:unnamed protein product [Fusarium equiseti]|uniref:DUF7580 domain-containing protein n=1 Tax=Fusarium equiseti TaxID=61235 RepID=A0A8J2ISQ7_FUSEQ|nr:unnamed protein product [Fusarium equiseti]
METAGVVLGAIPLVLYTFDNYERCLGQINDYLRYQSTLQTIRTHVFIQGEQLNVTLSGIGLTRPTRQELEEHLSEIYTKAKCDEFMVIIDRMEALLAKMMVSLDVDSSGKYSPDGQTLLPARANWEWRRVKRSFRRKERQAFIDELRYWNECLKNVFDKTEIPSDESDQLAERLQARYNQRECDRIRENLLIASKLDILAVYPYPSGRKGQAEYTVARESTKYLAWSLTSDASYAITQKAEVQRNISPIKKAAGVPLDAGHSSYLGKRGQRKENNKNRSSGDATKAQDESASSWAVLYLCGSPWLDDDWDGKNHLQLFLEEAQGAGPASLQADYPSISQLFKPTSQRLSSGSINPVTDFQNSQIRNKTLFNLGILLIELCPNKTLDQLRRELRPNGFAASVGVLSPEPSDFEVANRLTEDIYLEAGHSYGYAVQRCLRCEFPGRDVTKDFEFQPFRRHFFNGVVAPIQVTFEMQPASLLNH